MWGERSTDEAACVRCLEAHDPMYLDRLMWCDACVRTARNLAGWYGWLGGTGLGVGVALYVWIIIRPELVIGGWLATVVAATWIGQKIAREIVYGVMRWRNVQAIESAQPTTAEDPGSA